MQGNLRLVIMGMLARGSKSGYEIIKCMEREMQWKPSFGSLYPMLQKLEEEGYVKSKSEGKKNIYSLTLKGKALLFRLKRNKDTFVGSLKKIFNVMDSITGDNFSGKLMPMLESLCTNYNEISKLEPELTEFNSAIFESAKRKDIKKAKRVLKEATKKLKK